ncbi:autotransporter-associated N-terminal domain-containing protein [Fusobacterium ulcerans]|uniref:autotransporter-associated N-terminal domain-containing protein n=2 Tax=Fusobacterium ulcerans TaxID=861 RepID=UPI001D0BC18C|nr:autotransporter-associated N-terminal domain-containing protein [Fusobacterium ulcerans]MCB8564692.1 autotransporter-associated N-terminal domain-containing protein [Fusobacterium ulcerans]
MRKNDIEKSLKRFLKRKISYSLSLLIAFMITGGISFGAGITTEEIQETKNDILTRIETEREEIKRKIAENERLIKEYNSDFVELVRKGDFYSKPLIPSTQVFFSYQYLDNGKTKDRTAKEFKETIDAVNKHYGTTSGESLLKSTGNIGKDKVLSGNGVVVDNEVFRETIEVGANIKPVEPVLPTISPNVSVNVSAPVVNLGTLPGTVNPIMPSVPSVIAPTITAPSTPGGINVNVSTPAAVAKITVTAPTAKKPIISAEKNIEIKTPTLPQGYEPTMITLPTAPTLPVVVPVNVSSPSIAGSGANPSVQYFWWNGNYGVISQISLKSGEYIINGNSGNYSVGVTGYDAEAFPGTAPSGTKPTENKVYNVSQQFFHTLLNVPYSYYGENTKIVFNSNNAKLIDLETEGMVNGNLDNRVTEGLITSATRDRLREYQTYTGIKGEDGTELLFVNKGEIEINGTGSAYFFTTSHTNGNYRTNYLDNEGTITVNGDKSIVYMHSPDTSTSKAYIYSNGPTGKIYVDGVGASLMQWAYSYLPNNRAAFVNEGTAEIRGAEAIALYMSNNSTFNNGHAAYIKKAIDLLGDKSIGMVAQNTNIINEKNIVKFNIGNKEQTIVKGNSLTSIFTNADGTPRANDPTLVEQGIGILMDNSSTTKTAAQIEIGKYSYGGIGIFGKQGTIEILAPSGTSGEKSNITISDGEKNTGIIAKGGDVKFNGDILIKGGKDNRAAVAESGKKITITGNVTAGSNDKKIEDSVILYAKDNGTVITVENDKLNLKLSGDSTGIFATSQGKVVANRTSLTLSQPDASGNVPEPTAEVNIYVEGKKDTDGKIKGLGLYTSSGGNISAKNTYVKVKNGAVGIASVGNGSKVDLTGGIIDYEGNGYAVYTSDNGEIDLTNGEIILRGKATALELDFAGGVNPIKLQGARITVMSNDAIIANLKNAGVLNIGNLESNITGKLGGVTFKNGTNGSEVFDKYKVAAIDGGTLNIDTNIDKGDTSTSSPGFYYYRRFLGQRLKINVLDNVTVNASINSAYASEYFKGQVVGLEINSSSSATGISDTQINLGQGAKIVASRLDSGSGAIGAYINYGEITLDTGSSIEVEKTLKNENGVGIYAVNGSKVTNLGTLKLGSDGIGIMADGASTITATNVILGSNAGTDDSGKTGVFYKGSASGIDNKSIGLNINAENLDKGTAIYVENMNVTSSGTLNVGKEGIGIFVKGNSTQTGTNTGTIDLTAGKNDAVGMYTTTANLLNNTGGSINVNDTSQIGMYAEEANHKATNKGTINLNADNSTGIYVKLGAVAELNTGNSIVFNKKFSVGVFAENATVNFKDDLTFANNNENKNIYVYGKGATVGIDPGKIVTVDGMGTPATAGNKTVGIYLENETAGSTFTSNTTGQLVVQREAVGIYSKGNNTLNVNVTATGEKTTGVFIDGGSTITGTVTAQGTSTAGAVGVYGSGGAVTIGAGGLALKTDTGKGTGMYLTDGAHAAGGKITVNNTATVDNIGVYYSKGTASGTVTNGAEVELTGSKSIGIYAADGINLVNTKNITSTGLNNNIASYVGGNSTLTSNGNITMTGTDGNIGIYTGKGSGINNGAIDLTGSTGTSSAGMVAKTDTSSDTASVENKNRITVGSNLGMYVAGNGTSSGKNTGTITATTGTGVYVDGAAHSFNGTGGTIASNAVGIYLKDTGANKITAGTLNIGSGGVGVFGENAKIDFAVNVTGTGAVGVAAKSGTVISGNITTGQGSVGAYLLDGTVTFNGANITTGANSSSGTSVGVLFDNTIAGPYTMNNVSVNAKNGVGIYLGGAGMTLNHNGTVTTEGGIGIYVKNGTTLTTGESTLNISNGGTGVYIDGGIANLGTSGNLKFNFGTGGGIGVFNNGGTLNLGNNITAIGSGSLAATSNGSLISSGNLNIGEGGTGLLGTYDNGTTTLKNITNNGGTITAHTGGIGLAAIKGTSTPTAKVTINNSGIINANGISNGVNPSPSIGIFTDVADVINTGTINVGSNGIGIYSNHNGVLTSVKNDNMKMTGTDGIGVYLKGTIAGLTSNNINSTGSRNTGVVLEGVTSAIDAGTITLGNESIGVLATNGTNSLIDGTISVGASSGTKSAIGIVANGGSNVTVAGTSTITAGNGGIGVYAEGAGTIVTVADTGNITVGTDGIYMYSKGAALTFTGNITADNQIGIVADGGSVTSSGSSSITAKNGGIGAYVKNAAPAFGTTAITVQSGVAETTSAPAKYSVGIYYDSVASAGIIPTVTQTGNYTIGRVLNKSTGTVAGGISIGSSGNNQVGVMAKENSNLTVTGGISVIGGNSNIGVYGKSSAIAVNGNISVASAASLTNSSIGVFIDKGTYNGTTGDISVGNNSIGIYGKDLNGGSISQTGTVMTVGNNGVGIYGTGTGNGTENINLTMTTGITLGNNNSIGVYAKNINSSVTGDMYVGTNTSIGIVSEGNGNVTYTGDLVIANKGTGEKDTGSVGIYKLNGTGTINTLAGNWNVGNNGYGIFLKQAAGQSATINNNADMTLGTAAVGIFSSGKNTVNNTGEIIVGKTDVKGDHDNIENHLNSIGIYATGGTKVNNAGNITVNYDHSVGIYGDGAETRIQNTGTINVDGGGVGILVRDGAVAVNAVGGNIILGSTSAPDPCTATTIGMAAYSGARIENAGTITVNEGVGMLIGQGATFDNSGTIYLKNGIGIEGPGAVNNYGNIIILPGGNGTPGANVGVSKAEVGSVKIESDGTITINDKYVSIGGTLSTAGNIVVNGAYVDVTTGTPLFNANSVSGEVKLLPNFAATGNGISYEIEGFINTAMGTITGNKLTPVTSPLFIAKVTDKGSLVIAKKPYADLTIGDQFDALDKGLDNILKNSGGNGKDAEILKGLNEYLEGLPADQFERETSLKLAETRGDIYATIQGRMQDINRAFDNSFYELESSYNLTKDSSKYSVIYTDGNYKDSTLGIDDYDYKVMGVLYMKEKEGTKYGSKYGYTLGFTGSKFDFDDGGSKEDVYSLRVGAHRVKNLSEEHKVSWLSRIELGYNRHIAKRKLNLQETFENKGEYNTYSVALDNRLTKVIYTDLSRQLDVYADLDLEYGKVDDFKESAGSKGGLEVQIKDNDYLSAQAGAGVKASQRIYAGNDVSVKVTADVKYAYELGDNYDGNKARLKNGGEGYYSLITPEESEGKLTGKIGLTIEKANHMGVTFEVEAADEGNRKDSSIKYGMRFNYKF